jgi:hypothetical protein
VLGGDAFATRLEKVKDLAASGNRLAVQQLLDEPEQQSGVAELAIREQGEDVEEVPDLDEGGGLDRRRCLAGIIR